MTAQASERILYVCSRHELADDIGRSKLTNASQTGEIGEICEVGLDRLVLLAELSTIEPLMLLPHNASCCGVWTTSRMLA